MWCNQNTRKLTVLAGVQPAPRPHSRGPVQDAKAFPRSKDHTLCKTHPDLTEKANVLTEPHWVRSPQTLLNTEANAKHTLKMSSRLLNLNKQWHSSEGDDISFTTSSVQVTMSRRAETGSCYHSCGQEQSTEIESRWPRCWIWQTVRAAFTKRFQGWWENLASIRGRQGNLSKELAMI